MECICTVVYLFKILRNIFKITQLPNLNNESAVDMKKIFYHLWSAFFAFHSKSDSNLKDLIAEDLKEEIPELKVN